MKSKGKLLNNSTNKQKKKNEWINKQMEQAVKQTRPSRPIWCNVWIVERMRYQQTDQPTDRPADRASYRGALSHLKRWNKIDSSLPYFVHQASSRSLRRGCLQKARIKKVWLEKRLGGDLGEKVVYRIARNGKEILLNFLKTFFFILWTMEIQGVEGRARSQSFTSGHSSIFAILHKDTSRFAIWPTLMLRIYINI